MLKILNIRHINNYHHNYNIKQRLLSVYVFIWYPLYLFSGRRLKELDHAVTNFIVCTDLINLEYFFFEWIYIHIMPKNIMRQKELIYQVFCGNLCSFHLYIVNTFFEVSKYTVTYLREEITSFVHLCLINPSAHWLAHSRLSTMDRYRFFKCLWLWKPDWKDCMM